MRLIIAWFYTSKKLWSTGELMQILESSIRFDIPHLKAHCEAILQENIDIYSAAGLFNLARVYHLKEVMKASCAFIYANYACIKLTEGKASFFS
jgi:hypothetical protein